MTRFLLLVSTITSIFLRDPGCVHCIVCFTVGIPPLALRLPLPMIHPNNSDSTTDLLDVKRQTSLVHLELVVVRPTHADFEIGRAFGLAILNIPSDVAKNHLTHRGATEQFLIVLA